MSLNPESRTLLDSNNEAREELSESPTGGAESQEFYSGTHHQQLQQRDLNLDMSKMVFQRQGKPQQRLILACHFAFKFAAFFTYVLCNIIGLGYISTFVFVLMLLSIDFWVVKNLSGRLLAGLRWWSTTEEDTGKMVWKFEAWTREERQVAYKSQVITVLYSTEVALSR